MYTKNDETQTVLITQILQLHKVQTDFLKPELPFPGENKKNDRRLDVIPLLWLHLMGYVPFTGKLGIAENS